ncbi:hypothetical protein B9Z65_4209 [Elsinoe australis]|uniref:Uncharacterized protein n=1 Tax=Elsinoe australis TaxID=40998 RepID=A0A2P7Z252_9PEZI|nr:hypothetical protein B9Z65_4209 [Elsinoe australis]
MASSSCGPEGQELSSSPNEQARSSEALIKKEDEEDEETSDESAVFLELPQASPEAVVAPEISAERSTLSPLNMFDIDTASPPRTSPRTKKQNQLLTQGFSQPQIDQFLTRPCFDTATSLIRSKALGTGNRPSASARTSNYKHLRLNPSSTSKNWVLLNPLLPHQLLRSLSPTPSEVPQGTDLWKTPQEHIFLHMLQYAFYAPPTPVSSNAPTSCTLSPTTSGATLSTEQAPSHFPVQNPASSRIRKLTPVLPLSKAHRQRQVGVGEARSVESGSGDGVGESGNPVDRFLEYNLVSHAVRLRAGFQARFGGQGREVVYTANGPRWGGEVGVEVKAGTEMEGGDEIGEDGGGRKGSRWVGSGGSVNGRVGKAKGKEKTNGVGGDVEMAGVKEDMKAIRNSLAEVEADGDGDADDEVDGLEGGGKRIKSEWSDSDSSALTELDSDDVSPASSA